MESSASGTNNTSLANHLLHSIPSLAQRAGLAIIHPLEVIDHIARPLWKGGSIIADATTQQPNTTSFLANNSTALAQSSTAAAAATPNPTMSELLQESFTQTAQAWREGGSNNNLGFSASNPPSTASALLTTLLTNLAKLKDFGGIFTYLTSKWALTTFVVAILLNRTQFYASSRQNLLLPWYVRVALYGVPICLFLVQVGNVLQALRCQTSPDFALLRYGDPLKKLGIDFGGEGGMLYALSARLLFWQGSDGEACEAVGFSLGSTGVVGSAEGGMDFRGSLSLLFGFFLTVCTSQFFDTLACTLQGRQPKPETGMTIFEHSLAFAECEAMISSALGLGFLGVARQNDAAGGSGRTAPLLTRSEILPRLNVPPEVLLVCLISCFSHLSSAMLAVFDIRHRVRLVNTGIWALSYMSAFIWTFCRLFFQSFDGVAELGALRFPTVCMVGFIPHLLILTGIIVCGAIYGLALLITALSLPREPGTPFHHRWNRAYQNLQANVQFSAASSLRIKMSEDFYTALLKIGFNVLTAASEAVYLNEGSHIHVAESTWLERKRLREIADDAELRRRRSRRRRLPSIPSELLSDDVIARGIDFVDRQNDGEVAFQSPYARERKSKSRKQPHRGQSSGRDGDPGAAAQGGGEVESGIGITQRRNRAQMTFDFFAGVWGLFGSVLAQGLLRLLGTLGLEPQRCPAWLVKMAGIRDDGHEGRGEEETSSLHRHPLSLVNMTRNQRDFWMLGPEGRLMIAPNDEVDVEVETRRMLQRSGTYFGEETLAEHIYAWWRRGGWFGSVDGSGDYVGRSATNDDDDDDEDTTSVLSMSTNESTCDEDGEGIESGRRTPTQDDPFGARRFDRELSPAASIATDENGSALDMAQIARLLNPQTTAERDEARLLSHALLSPRPTTRSQYRLHTTRARSRVLGFWGGDENSHLSSGKTTEEQEEEDLEAFLLTQRDKKTGSLADGTGVGSDNGTTWQTGAEGLGDSGPQCVVCQSSPRTVLVWPSPAVPRSPTPSSQHGYLPAHHQPVSSLPLPAGDERHDAGLTATATGGGDGGTTTPDPSEQLVRDAAFAAFLQESERQRVSAASEGQQQQQQSRNQRQRTMTTTTTTTTPSPPPPPVPATPNRIAEYENAAIATPFSQRAGARREGPGFEVIKKVRSPGDKRAPVLDLPNEVLTHALAHLAPTDLTSVASVSKRFHELVTGPHAWRSAFAHYFPGPDTMHADLVNDADDEETVVQQQQAVVRSERRAFTRLTALASWRSEYINRTRLLRSLARGKPVQSVASGPSGSSRNGGGQSHNAQPTIMYNSQLFTTINHLHAIFAGGATGSGWGSSGHKKLPRFIHGADDTGTATTSDPGAGKVDSWGQSDPQFFVQFADRFPGDSQYGLGPGEVVGAPNVMDVSQPYGLVYGEGSPGGMAYYRATEEMRGRFLMFSSAMSVPEIGIPRLHSANEAMTSIWIAKSATIPSLTEGLIGIMTGSSLGVVNAYSLGSTGTGGTSNREHRFLRGETTARWVLSPGVPIISIAVDPEYCLSRQAQNRIWAVALNALGEVFYLTKFPKRPTLDRAAPMDDELAERTAWLTGRSVYWNLVEPSRRVARMDPYAEPGADGSYSPRSSWNGMCLSPEQIRAETLEMEAFARKKPKDFRAVCSGWDMRRRLEVDFAGDDGNLAGENVVVVECGLEEDGISTAAVQRFTRCRFQEGGGTSGSVTPPSMTSGTTEASNEPSLFGGGTSPPAGTESAPSLDRLGGALPADDFGGSITPRPMSEEWRTSKMTFGGLKKVQVLATTIDNSTFATQTCSEDPLLGFSGRSTTSSPSLTPLSPSDQPSANDPVDVPGQRARLFAIGTKTGSVLVWNIRAPYPKAAETTNTLDPVRIIYTDSPQISCLAMSALYLVHGGSDGLVQAWDPLGSSLQPIRTMNSRFSARARRRLAQAQASPQGVGINLFAAGAITLDPDPAVLRGMVSLGINLLYWSFSSSAADQYRSSAKRRLRRSERGSNNALGTGGSGFSTATRNNLKDYIAHEQNELELEKAQRNREHQRFVGRYGTEFLDGSEEEQMAYVAMISQESFEKEARGRSSFSSSPFEGPAAKEGSLAVDSRATSEGKDAQRDGGAKVTRDGNVGGRHTGSGKDAPASSSTPSGEIQEDEEMDADVAEAIRQSLLSSSAPPEGGELNAYEIPFRRGKKSAVEDRDDPVVRQETNEMQDAASSTMPSGSGRRYSGGDGGSGDGEGSRGNELDDLEFAMQLSLAEEESRREQQRMQQHWEGDVGDCGEEGRDGDGDGNGNGNGDEFPALVEQGGGVMKGKGKGRMV
ncbi:hypothetical protein KC332_g11452 [Hortaea werneckii]|nr:hypothetical protein KC350_g14217 [Hortaea werneckii]KAI6841003.1 hypothetical protein KC358_g4316 [Hortaea werneckii]KAI6939495.1 hypothetical protein KC341_g4139 [Hortaea werneckii]KAI6942308.1 hypothetical protein KC348_g4472 [Hortaea werneckii]KAI6975976.1 hypothetical protein KC321_g4256 [Hortaea werneckii]